MRPTHPLQGATAWASSLPAQEGGRLPDLDRHLGVRLPCLLGSLQEPGPGEWASGQKAGSSHWGQLYPTCPTCYGAQAEGWLLRLHMTLSEFILNADLSRAPSSFSTRWQWRPIGMSSDTWDHTARAGVGRGGW